MSTGFLVSIVFGVLTPCSLIFSCINEFMAVRLAKNARCDKNRLQKLYTSADVGNVLAWVFLAAAYIVVSSVSVDTAIQAMFYNLMKWLLIVILLADVYFLYLRRNRAPEYRGKRQFWEKK